jgi:capsular polysaccharide transport system permease protein
MQRTIADPTDFQAPKAPQVPKTLRFRTLRVIVALILREIGSHDSRSSLGFLWSIIDPIATVVILSLAFSLLTRTPPLGTNFPLFYITGIVPFHIYTQISGRVSSSVRFSRQLLGFPGVTILDALFARAILTYVINVVVFAALSIGVIYYYGLRVNLDVEPVLFGLLMAGLLGLSVGAFNSVLFMLFPAYENLWGMANRPMMIASGTLVMIEDLPTWLFNILWWNPVAHMIAEVRHGFYATFHADWASPTYVFLFCGISFAIGLVTLDRYALTAIER